MGEGQAEKREAGGENTTGQEPTTCRGDCDPLYTRVDLKPTRNALICWLSLLALALLLAASASAQAPITFQYFYDDLGQLVKVIDSSGNVIEYVYDEVGNIVQIKRGTGPASGTLAIFNFTPQQGGIGDTVTIQGQGFSTNLLGNTVRFNGTSAAITSATTTTLVVTVPVVASTGPISVTVGATTAQSTNNFTVIPVPVITAMSRHSALFNAVIPNLTVTGTNFTGATFSFQTSALTITAVSIDPSGTSAQLSVSVGTQAGTFPLVATNSFGSSNPGLTHSNEFTVVDPNSTADSDGDGFPDIVEAANGSDPLDPQSVPTIMTATAPEVDSRTISLLNGTAPPPLMGLEADSPTFSVHNTANAVLVPLVGGSGGAGSNNRGVPLSNVPYGSGGGAGGGAILVASSTTITVNGTIAANGGAAGDLGCHPSGGGGAGGSVRLAAPTISGNGRLTATGGNGVINSAGTLAGGDGIIRLEAFTDAFTGSLQGTQHIGSPFNTFIPATGPPAVTVTSVNGVPVTQPPTGNLGTPDVTINTGAAVELTIQAQFIPPGTVLTLKVFSDNDTDQIVQTTPLLGTLQSSTATAKVTFPSGFSLNYVKATWTP